MIKQISLDHSGGFYLYKLHNRKLKQLCKAYPGLTSYLNDVFTKCPNEYFQAGPRSSKLKFKLNGLIHQIVGHEVSDMALNGLRINNDNYKTNHSKVQLFMLENDDKTIAMEIPIWIEPDELGSIKNVVDNKLPLTGHIDILRLEEGKIWIWDYKPNAYNEKYAATQVYFYALMLSKRSGIALDNFRCGYFDSFYAYIFKPEDCKIDVNLFNKFYITSYYI